MVHTGLKILNRAIVKNSVTIKHSNRISFPWLFRHRVEIQQLNIQQLNSENTLGLKKRGHLKVIRRSFANQSGLYRGMIGSNCINQCQICIMSNKSLPMPRMNHTV